MRRRLESLGLRATRSVLKILANGAFRSSRTRYPLRKEKQEMKSLKFGIIGTGMISGLFTEAVREVSGVSVSTVLSRKRETGEDFVRRNYSDRSSVPEVVTEIKDLFSSDVNAIYVASPNRFHAETAIGAMRAGYDVLCEKPIASDLKEYDEMLSVSEKTGKVLLEAMRPSFDPAYEKVKRAIKTLGRLRHATFEYC